MAYSDDEKLEIKSRVCREIAGGKSLRKICDAQDMPSSETVRQWLIDDAGFSVQYARAREEQADYYADEITEIADTEADPNKARVRIDARKWAASKLKPKVYGDRLTLDGDVTVKMDDDSLNARITQLLGKAGAGSPSSGAGTKEEAS